MEVARGQGVQAALFHREAVGEAAYRPTGAGGQPVARHAQGQRQVPAVVGHLGQRGRVGSRPFRTYQGGQEGSGLFRAQFAQWQAVHALQAGEHPPAGHHHHSGTGTGQQRTDLGLVAGVVQHQQVPPVGQHLPVQPGAALRPRLRQVTVGHAEGLEHPQHQLGRLGRNLVHAPQVHHQLPVREPVGQFPGGMQRQRGLARARRSGHRRHHRTLRGRGAMLRPLGRAWQAGGPDGELRQPGELPLAAHEVVDAAGESAYAQRTVPPAATGPGGGQQPFPLRLAQPQPRGERGHRSPLRRRPSAAFQIADAPHAHARSRGQGLDRQRRPQPQFPQQRPERRALPRHHASRRPARAELPEHVRDILTGNYFWRAARVRDSRTRRHATARDRSPPGGRAGRGGASGRRVTVSAAPLPVAPGCAVAPRGCLPRLRGRGRAVLRAGPPRPSCPPA